MKSLIRSFGSAHRVCNQMGFGFLESVYEKCLEIELRKARLQVERQRAIKVFYESEIVGKFAADLIVEDLIIVELKAVREIATAHEIPLVNYLVATKKDVGLILNFAEKSVEVKKCEP